MKKIRILQNTGLIVLDSNKRYDYMPKDVFIKMFLPQGVKRINFLAQLDIL